MKSLLLALALTLSSAAVARADYPCKEAFSRSGAFAADGRIILENVNGRIEVRTWDKNQILIEGEKTAKSEDELKLIGLDIDLTDTSAGIKVHLPKRHGLWGSNIRAAVNFRLTVPVTAALAKISSVNSSITVEGVRGPVHLDSVNGGIRATGLGAEARLNTVNGGIRAAFASIGSDQQLSFETVNGGIDISLPPDAGASIDASVVNGRIRCDFPVTIEGRIGRHLHGTIGDGRATIRASSVNGGIHLESL
ncbi:MAG TPA: DUF4097 family beta strand repeat-containing protein [Opitutus sp.]|nr:DUF4097 family beta strand repeat-containing protein [Opitutus sp.]